MFINGCPLCKSQLTKELGRDKNRRYFRCAVCRLIFVEREALLKPEDEKKRYDLHNNDPADGGYRDFLSRLAISLTDRLKKLKNQNLCGLDFGSGPVPVLSMIMKEAGFSMSLYDPFYAPDTAVLNKQYDFVTCTETMEHFYLPFKEWRLLIDLIKPGGWLGIMTKMLPHTDEFLSWFYKNDSTHVSFYSKETFLFLANRDNLKCEFADEDVILFNKPKPPTTQI